MFFDRTVKTPRDSSGLKSHFRKDAGSRRRRLRPEREILEERLAPATGAWAALGAGYMGPVQVSSVSSTGGGGEAAKSANLSQEAQYAVSEAIGRDDPTYAMAASGGGYTLSNATNQYVASVDAGGLHVASGSDSFSLTLQGIGYGDDSRPVGSGQASSTGNRVEYDYGGISQWFVNGPLGLQQGFTLAQRPSASASGGPLTVDLALGGDLTATADAGGRSVTLARADGAAALSYGGLIAYDATGRATPAYLSVHSTADGDVLSIQVDDADAVYPLVIDPFVQQARLTTSTSQDVSFFGYSVSISGDGNRAVVGSKEAVVGFNNGAGAVYVFDRVGTTWTQTAKLTASDGVAGDSLGYSVAISLDGLTVTSGAAAAPVGGAAQRGAVYVFSKSGATWTQTAKLAASDGAAGDFLGSSVSISGNGAVIGAGAASATVAGKAGQGAAYIFTRTGTTWTQTGKLTATDGAAGAALGLSVSISSDGSTLAASAPAATIAGKASQGAVYVFGNSGSSWSQTAKLTAVDGAAGDLLGKAVSIASDGGVVLAGAPYATVNGKTNQGAAYIFTRTGANWTQTNKLTAADGATEEYFGDSVALSANGVVAVVGADFAAVAGKANQGAVYVFGKSGANWTQTNRLTASNGAAGDLLGRAAAVNLDGTTIIAGSPNANVGTHFFQGASYVFHNAQPLAVSTNPVSQTAVKGTPTTFTAAATSPTTPSVQWQVSTNGGAWTNIAGATDTWYTVTPALADSGKRYRAVFSSGGASETTAAATLTVVKESTALSLSSNANPRQIGDALSFTINATAAGGGAGTPNGGTISINVGSVNLSGTLVNGKAVFSSIPTLAVGTYTVTATYDGANDPNFGSAVTTMTQLVVRGSSTLVGVVPTQARPGQSVTLTGVLSYNGTGTTPYGGIVFLDNGQPIQFVQVSATGATVSASFTTSTLAAGDHYFQLVYLGETVTTPASSGVYHLVVSAAAGNSVAASSSDGSSSATSSPAPNPITGGTTSGGTPQLSASSDPSSQTATAGNPTTLTAAATNPSATPSVQWQVSTNSGGTWTNIADATNAWYTFTPALADSGNRYRAVFSGGGGATETTASATLTVVKGTTALSLSSNVNPRRLGDALSFTINATSAAGGAATPSGGTISLNIGSVNLSGTLVNGKAVFSSVPTLAAGTYTVTATYNGANDPNFGSAVTTMTQLVVRGSSTLVGVVPTQARPGQSVTLTGVLSYEGTGTPPYGGIMFLDNGQPIQFVQVSATGATVSASFTTSRLAAGDHYFQMVYLGETVTTPASTGVYHLVVSAAAGNSVVASSTSGSSALTPMALTVGAQSLATTSVEASNVAAASASIATTPTRKRLGAFEARKVRTVPAKVVALPSAVAARGLQQRYSVSYKTR